MVASLKERADLVQVTYQVLSEKLIDPEKKARALAEGSPSGFRLLAGADSKMAAKIRGHVLGIDERTHVQGQPYEYYLTIGFPPAGTENDIPSLLLQILSPLRAGEPGRVERVELPEYFLKGKGPRFGIEGLRALTGEPDKPLLMAVLPAYAGLTPAQFGSLFFELALGGAQLVREDAALANLSSCPDEKRLEACLAARERARAESGRAPVFALHLTGSPSRLIAKATRLVKQGAEAFLINSLIYGYGLVEELVEVGVPILSSPMMNGPIPGETAFSLSPAVLLGTLARVAGADAALFPWQEGSTAPASDPLTFKRTLTGTQGSCKRSLPAPLGTIHPGLVPRLLAEYGHDVLVNAGSFAYAHPQGARAGIKAFRQAINWTLRRGKLGVISQREFPELSEALRLWGRTSQPHSGVRPQRRQGV